MFLLYWMWFFFFIENFLLKLKLFEDSVILLYNISIGYLGFVIGNGFSDLFVGLKDYGNVFIIVFLISLFFIKLLVGKWLWGF